MSRKFIFIPMLAAAVACSDSDNPISVGSRPTAPETLSDGYEMVTGTVVSEREFRRNDTGEVIEVIGPQADLLGGLVGAEIRILGTADELGATALWIIEFRVLTVDGLPALDGTFAESEEGFGVHINEGDFIAVEAVPDELMEHLGDRVWLTTYDGRCVRFGVLEM